MIDRDNIIRMAREAGLAALLRDTQKTHEALERFAALVAALVAAAEREACAKLCDDNADCCHPGSVLHSVLGANAAAIRARGQA